MTTVWQIFEWLQFVTDTNRNGACTPEEAAMALDSAQQIFYQECIDRKQYDTLRLLHNEAVLTSDPTGLVAYPADYGHRVTLMKDYTVLSEIRHTEVYERMNSALYPPTYNKPVYVVEKNGFQLLPKLTNTITLHYYAKPGTPKIAYALSNTGGISYDPANSKQLDFPPEHWMNILLKACAFMGVNLGDQDVLALTQLNTTANDQ